jgi:activator of HSP90 ATPase
MHISISFMTYRFTLGLFFHSYKYKWTLSTASTPEVDAVFELAKSRLPAALEAKFAEFPKALIEAHGKDLTVTSTDHSRATTPSLGNKDRTIPATKSADATKQFKPAPKEAVISTRTVEVEATFQASADDLFSLFTDEKRIPAWSRAPAQVGPSRCWHAVRRLTRF